MTHPWFGGAEFSAADIMMKFPLDVATKLNLVDTEQFPKVAAWKTKIEARRPTSGCWRRLGRMD